MFRHGCTWGRRWCQCCWGRCRCRRIWMRQRRCMGLSAACCCTPTPAPESPHSCPRSCRYPPFARHALAPLAQNSVVPEFFLGCSVCCGTCTMAAYLYIPVACCSSDAQGGSGNCLLGSCYQTTGLFEQVQKFRLSGSHICMTVGEPIPHLATLDCMHAM